MSTSQIINNLEGCIIEDVEPLLTTNYSTINGIISFSYARYDICRATDKFTETQIKHFDMIITWLQKQSVADKKSIHVFQSDANGITHYLEIVNVSYPNIVALDANANVPKPALKKFLLKYDPAIFDSNYKIPSIVRDLSVGFVKGTSNRIINTCASAICNIYNYVKTKKDGLSNAIVDQQQSFDPDARIFFTGSTVTNCLFHTIMFHMLINPFRESKHSLISASSFIIYGYAVTCIGKYIGTLYPAHSWIIFNGILLYTNIRHFLIASDPYM